MLPSLVSYLNHARSCQEFLMRHRLVQPPWSGYKRARWICEISWLRSCKSSSVNKWQVKWLCTTHRYLSYPTLIGWNINMATRWIWKCFGLLRIYFLTHCARLAGSHIHSAGQRWPVFSQHLVLQGSKPFFSLLCMLSFTLQLHKTDKTN